MIRNLDRPMIDISVLSSNMEVSGKVAFVTGGAQGLGKGICDRLLSKGAHVSKILDLWF